MLVGMPQRKRDGMDATPADRGGDGGPPRSMAGPQGGKEEEKEERWAGPGEIFIGGWKNDRK